MSTTRTHSTSRRRTLTLATLAGAALLVAACGGATTASPGATSPDTGSPAASLDTSPGTSPSGSGVVGGETASPTAGAADEDPCALLTAEDAGELLGTTVTGERSDTPVGTVCRYVPGDGTSGLAVATIHVDEAGDAFERAVTDFGLAELPGVGDTAAGVDGTIFVKSGDTLFSILATDATFQPIPLDDLADVAREAVERLGGENVTPSASPGGSESPSPSA